MGAGAASAQAKATGWAGGAGKPLGRGRKAWEVWKSGLAALAPRRLGKTTEPRVALGFPSGWEQSFPPHSLPVPVAGPVGRAAGGAEFSGGPLALGLGTGGAGAVGPGYLLPLCSTAGPGETAFFGELDGLRLTQPPRPFQGPPLHPRGRARALTHLAQHQFAGWFWQTTQHPKSQYSYLPNGNTGPPLKVLL